MPVCTVREIEPWWLKAHLSVPQALEGIPHWAFFILLRQESTTLLSVCSVSLKISVEMRFTRINQTRQNFYLIFCLHGYKPHTLESLKFARFTWATIAHRNLWLSSGKQPEFVLTGVLSLYCELENALYSKHYIVSCFKPGIHLTYLCSTFILEK